jgi:hypothetical protein
MNIYTRSSIVFFGCVFSIFCLLRSPSFAQAPLPTADTNAAIATSPSGIVCNWTLVPTGQQVVIDTAIIDQGGYQLADSDGDTIVVPFDNQNLYVMQFAVSTNGSMYFVNSGSTPTLYLPTDGYLNNASVTGTRWYPFTTSFQPTDPAYAGIAPSWHDFILMGWYSGMSFYGGFTCQTSFSDGGTFTAITGTYAEINGQQYTGWPSYRDYCDSNRAYNYVTYYSRGIYDRAATQLPANENPFGSAGAPVVTATAPSDPLYSTRPVVSTTAIIPASPGPAIAPNAPKRVFRGAIGYGFYGSPGEPAGPSEFRASVGYYNPGG